MIVDSAVYVDGRRIASPSLGEAYRSCHDPGRFAWVSLYEPTEEEFLAAAGEFGLDGVAVEEAIRVHQRPKLEHYGECSFLVLKSVRYVEDTGRIEFGEIHAFVARDFIVTVRHGEDPVLDEVRRRMEGEPDRLRRGPSTVFCEILHQVVEGYAPVVERLGNDIDEVEEKVLVDNAEVSGRIHELFREVIRFHQATKPLAGTLERLVESPDNALGPEARRRLRRVRDRVLRATEQIEGFRDLLSSILDVNLTMVGVQQNDQMQRISAWGAILIVPTLIAGIFGMNFESESFWWDQLKSYDYGFELSVGLMVLVAAVLYLRFKRSGWL